VRRLHLPACEIRTVIGECDPEVHLLSFPGVFLAPPLFEVTMCPSHLGSLAEVSTGESGRTRLENLPFTPDIFVEKGRQE
jgi:hypothetical protein